jgi:SAM-dependent methyltransferase
MRFSIFTPTNDAKFLTEAYRSLLAQTHDDWEWMIIPNNGVEIPLEINDPRVRSVRAPAWIVPLGVGALKRFACEQCMGEYFVELDHDDRLLPHALATIATAIDVHSPDFLYSDAANFREDGSFELYGKEWGWENYSQVAGDVTLYVNSSFPVDASSMSAIHFAPNHVRVWKKSAYWKVGGHDAALGVCDDYDLLCRTYLAGARMYHIPECLYLYRLRSDGENTWLKRNAEIQSKQLDLSNRYLHMLVQEWCRRNGLPMLDLGGATGCPPGYTPVDLKTGVDLRQKWPFDDSSVGCVRAVDFLEHVPHCKDSSCTHEAPFCVVGLMNEIYRVLAPGGWLLTATPSTDGRGAFQDPTHCSFWNVPNSFWYYSRRQQQQYVPGITARFQLVRCRNEFPSPWHHTHDILYGYADLVALKGQRQPGLVEI